MNDRHHPTTEIDFSIPMSRRAAIRAFAAAAAPIFALAAGGGAVLAQHTAQLYTVSTNANFRTGPGTGYTIIAVIAKGATFTLTGQSQNGYAGITYQGRGGWVLAAIVVAAGTTGSDPVISGQAWTTAGVNLRSGPGATYQVLRVVPKDSQIGVSTTERNGFLYVSYQGQTGWMSTAYIGYRDGGPGNGPVPNYLTTTANLNLRAEPSTSARVLLVIPSGSQVRPNGESMNNFAKVNYNGTVGWASFTYLR
jgi:zinc D-Ala-D-Ala carboxypeptidase